MAGTMVFAKGDVLGEVVRSFAVNEEINQLLIEKLDSRAWRVPLDKEEVFVKRQFTWAVREHRVSRQRG